MYNKDKKTNGRKRQAMNIFICGLGLIGGSIAKAVKAHTFHTVIGCDRDNAVCRAAVAEGAIDRAGSADDLASCDLVLVALYPDAAAAFVADNLSKFKPGAILVDTCGIKSEVAAKIAATVRGSGIRYIGGHPMAGTERSGFENSFGDLFAGASMILCPEYCDDEKALKTVSDFFLEIGFGRITLSSCAHHDEVIAFTSQLAHVASNAYIKSPTAKKHKGFSAGSYKDMTRVAWLAPHMWAELFMENKEFLLKEIDCYIEHLSEYKTAMEHDDEETLIRLLDEGKKRKEEVDG